MSRRKRRLNGEKLEPFVALPNNLIDSRAYAELSGNAAKLLTVLMRKFNGHNNGWIAFGYSNADKAGFSRQTTKRALMELWEKGIIKRTKAGVYRGNVSEWLLTFRRDNRNLHNKTDDWKQYPNNEKSDELKALLNEKK